MILNCKQKSILFCIIFFVWMWLSFLVKNENFINSFTEPSSQAMRMTGTDSIPVVGGGGNPTTFTSVKDRLKIFEGQPIMGVKGPQTLGSNTTTHGGSSTLGGGNVITSSSSAARGLGGGEVHHRILPQNAHNLDRLNTQLVAEQITRGHAFEKHLHEFREMGILTSNQLHAHAEFIMSAPETITKVLEKVTTNFGDIEILRRVYIYKPTSTVLIIDKTTEGTIYRAKDLTKELTKWGLK